MAVEAGRWAPSSGGINQVVAPSWVTLGSLPEAPKILAVPGESPAPPIPVEWPILFQQGFREAHKPCVQIALVALRQFDQCICTYRENKGWGKDTM